MLNQSLKDLKLIANMKILINVFFLLRKGVYPYKYLGNWEIFDEALLPDKEAFYSTLNKEDIADVDYRHAKRVLNNKNPGHIMICFF